MAKIKSVGDQEVELDRRRDDRRGDESPTIDAESTEDAGKTKKPRRKQQRRRQIDPTTCERDYNDEELRFMRALDDYKRVSGRMFPTCSEILEVVRSLGYIKLKDEEQELLDSVREVEQELAEATEPSTPDQSLDQELNGEDSEDEVETY